VAREHKARIRDAFQGRLSEPTGDVDRDLWAIRELLSGHYGAGFSFYDPEIMSIWDPVATEKKPWDEFIGWAKRIHDWSGFDAEEYDYKIEDGRRVAEALQAAASDSSEWLPLAEAALKATNLVRWQAWDNLLRWWKEHVGAENPIRPVQATIRYSWTRPPKRSVLRSLATSRFWITAGGMSRAEGVRWPRERCGRWVL
jgi:hypothetical protein